VTRTAPAVLQREQPFRTEIGYYEDRADGLRASAQDGTPGALARFERWHAPLTAAGARLVLARQHGLDSWAQLRAHVAALPDTAFVRAYRAVEAHDVHGLRAELARDPSLVAISGTNGNDLLGLASATCDERLVALLLENGADPSRANAHGWTPLHQAAQSGLVALSTMLLDAGAPVDVSARGDGGTPLIAALFWGKRATAELLAQRGVVPSNLRACAGLGRLDLVEQLLGDAGRLAAAAGAHRAFYRPHSGFPYWRPADDFQEIVDEALSWAARNDRADCLELLVARGARIDADVYRGTALAWAAATGARGALRRLLDLGADPSARTTFGGPDHGEQATALHLAAERNDLDAIRALLDAGADPTLRDGRHDHTPAGWAEHGGHAEARELLSSSCW